MTAKTIVFACVAVFAMVALPASQGRADHRPQDHSIPTGQYVDGALDASGAPVKIFVETAGDPANPPILFFHGLTINRIAFEKQFTKDHETAGKGRRLIDHYYLVRMDQRGHGKSDKPTDENEYLDGRKWADDVDAVITKLNLNKPVLVATSFGGASLLLYVEHYGQTNISGVVLVGTPQGVPNAGTPLNVRLTGVNGIASASAATNIAAVNDLQRAATLFPQREADFYRAVGARMQCPLHVRTAIVRSGPLRNFPPVIRSLTVPVLIVQGAQDALIRAPHAADTLARMIPHATKLIYDNCGHAAHVDQTERFNSDLDDFASSAFGDTSR